MQRTSGWLYGCLDAIKKNFLQGNTQLKWADDKCRRRRRMFVRMNCLKYGVVLSLILLGTTTALSQSSSFTYQGRLQDGGTNANGSYDFQFTLWDALSAGTQQPQPTPVTVTLNTIAVTNGIFTAQLDFGPSAFPGAARFL